MLLCFAAIGQSTPSQGTYEATQANLKIFKRADTLTFFSHLAGGSFYNNKSSSLARFGIYHKLSRTHKWGVFLRNQQGMRHSDDWIRAETGEWKWDDTSDRSEQVATLAYRLSYRFGSTPLHVRLQTEIEKNFWNHNERVIMRPSFNYFIFSQQGVEFSLHYAPSVYYALNFEREHLYKTGHYLALLYHISRRYQVGLNYQQIRERWSESSEQFKARNPGERYDVTDTINTLGLEFIVQI